MKRILLSWMLAVLAGSVTLWGQNMNDGHQLTGLWKQYEAARKADLPQKEAEVLSQIKLEAAAKNLPVDFYDAATAYVSAVQRRDWKQRETLREGLEKEVKDFDHPLVTFLWMWEWKSASTAELWAHIQAHASVLKEDNHPALYHGVDGFLNGSLKPFIRNDKEYALWYMRGRSYGLENQICKALAEEVAGVYPNEAVLEYNKITAQNWPKEKWEEEKVAYQALADKYAGKPFSVYPRAQILRIRYAQLQENKATSAQYQALYNDVTALEKERKAFTGDAKTLVAGCSAAENLAKTLSDKNLEVSFEDGRVEVLFRNLKDATVTLREGKTTLKTWQAVNPVDSFYVQDTVKLELPTLPDGEYTLEAKNGKISDTDAYTQYTLSIATRMDSRGRCVYVTDYETGVPLRNVTLRLRKSGKEVASSTLKLDGFTPLPQAFAQHLEGSTASWEVVAESGNRKSRSIFLDRNSKYNSKTYNDQLRCNIYKDRGAYNPGDTLQFKAIVFKGDPSLGLEVIKGRKVKMRLHDSEDNIIDTQTLTTNEWGAVSGSFVLPEGLRNGRFELEAEGLGYDWFRVDEFVLPTFELKFDSHEELYLVGDEVPVSGSLVSYSGHNLTGARIRVKVTCYGDGVYDQEVPVEEGNTFKTSFKATTSGYYRADVTVTEATGETHSFGTGWYIGEDLSVSATVKDAVDAEMVLNDPEDNDERYYWRRSHPKYLVENPAVKLELQARDAGGNPVPLPVKYELVDASGKPVASGEVASGKELSLQLPADGLYRLKATVSAQNAAGKKVSGEQKIRIVCQRPDNRKLAGDVKRVFVSGPADVAAKGSVTARIGTSEGDAWAVVTLYGEKRQVLVHQTLHVKSGSMDGVSFAYKDNYPDAVRLQVFYFIHGKAISYEREYRRAKDKYSLPLSFTRFQDKAYPGTEYSFTVKTAAGAEVLAAAWDKSMDAIETNDWPLVNLRDFSVESVYISSACGRVGSDDDHVVYYERGLAKSSASINMMAMADAAVESEEAAPFQLVEEKPAFGGSPAQVDIREKFASALTFQPHLKPSADGTLTFSFRTSDKLSTYYVRVYAHDKQMHNAMTQEEMVVSLPVKVSILEPRYLYVGDIYHAAVTVSSIADVPVTGELSLQVGDKIDTVPVEVPAGGIVTKYFPITCHSERSEESLTLTAIFKASDFSDAVRVHVPVYEASQGLTEAHSAVLRAGMSYEALLSELQGRFVNVPGSSATLRDITVLDMVRDAIPQHVEPKNNDVLALSEAWYVQQMASRLNAVKEADVEEGELLSKILACRNADGGFAWFEGMKSSPVITAVMLERFARLRDRGFDVPDMTATVKYLDKNQFGTVQPYWCGWLSDAQYVYVRAMYASVPFTEKAVSSAEKKRFEQFTKDVKDNLVPSKKAGRGLEGQILAKSRRLLTLRNLLERDGGLALAKAWGIKLGTSAKLKNSIKADVASLLEYAVEHRDGGWYYPNAVMPWRGLLESEAYAHALLCDLLSDTQIADGIRLWLMLQKETQKWDEEPAFIDAITAILDGSEAVLSTRVLALSATYTAPLEEIKAAGNGFTIERKFFREGVEIQPGDPVKVGDRITVKYEIWNGENRSFVRLTAGREASLSPVQQLSGLIGWTGYRNVKASATEYYYDTYPEEKTTVTEDFFVERAGAFVAPVTVIQSLYAPHYRANSAYRPPLRSMVP